MLRQVHACMYRIYHVLMVHHCSVLGWCIYGDQEDVVWNAYLYGTVGVCLIV